MFAAYKPMQKKYFIAIVLEGDLFEKAESIKHELYKKFGLKGALRSPSHVTLHRPFSWKEEKENSLISTLKNFKFQKPFDVELNGFNCFEPRVIYIDTVKNENLYFLHAQLTQFVAKNLKLLNEAEDMRGFHPHVTVAFRDLKKNLFYTLWEEFKTKEFSGKMQISSISLLKLNKTWEELEKFDI